MKALGIIDNIEVVEKLVPISKIYRPDIRNYEVYMKTFEIYERLYLKSKIE